MGTLAAVLVMVGGFTAGGAAASSMGSGVSAASVVVAAALSAPQGGTITISGNVSPSSACMPGVPVQVTSMAAPGSANLFADGLGPKFPRDADGNFSATFVIPASTPVGSYTIGLLCNGQVAGSTQTLVVTAGAHVMPSITVDPTSAQPGDSVTISGVVPTTGTVFCPSGDRTQLTSTTKLFPPDGLGPQVTRDATGSFHTTYMIPATTPVGSYSIGVRCGGGNVGSMAKLQVGTTGTTTTTASTTTTVASTVPSTTTTTTSRTTTTVARATTVPATTIAPAHPSGGKSTSTTKHLPWIALGALVLVVLVAFGLFAVGRDGGAGPV